MELGTIGLFGKLTAPMFGKMMASLVPPAIPFFLAQAGVIGQDTGVSFVVVGSIIGGAWYLNGRLTRIEDCIDQVKRDILTQSTTAATAAASAALVVVQDRMTAMQHNQDQIKRDQIKRDAQNS